MTTKTRIITFTASFAAILVLATGYFMLKSTKRIGSTDINHDGITNNIDLNILKANFNKKSSIWHYNPADINGDGIVNIDDFSLLMSNFGKKSDLN
jgi:hypothetical protein